MKYLFHDVKHCNMCLSPTTNHRLLGRRLNGSQGLRPSRKSGLCTTVVQCQVCGLIFSNPLPLPDSIADHYGIPPEHYWKDAYFVADPKYFVPQIQLFERLSGKRPASDRLTALDIGSGIGKCMRALAAAGFHAFGVEPSEPFHRMAVSKMGIPRPQLQLATFEDAQFEPESFDFITFGAVLEHLADPAAALAKAAGLLRPGGLIHVEVPSSSWLMSRIARAFYRMTGSDYVINLSPMHAPFHLYEFTPSCFQRHGSRNNYEVRYHQYHVCQTYAPGVLDKILGKVMRLTDTGMQLEVWLTKTRRDSARAAGTVGIGAVGINLP